jgi:hypothetical protein
MLVRELIQDILDEIGQLVGGNPASDTDVAKCRRLINKCVREYNVQGFLHFSRSRLQLGQGKEFLFEDKIPLNVNAVYYKTGPDYIKLSPVQAHNMPAYEGIGCTPYKYAYEKFFDENGDLKSKLILDRNSTYEVEAVVTYDLEPFNEDDVLTLPPEFINLLTADVQYRWVSNLAINDELKRDKKAERDKLLEYIKEIETQALDVPTPCYNIADKFYGGVGRFPW